MNKPTEREMSLAFQAYKAEKPVRDKIEGIAQALADYRMELANLFEKDDVLCRDGFEDNIREAIENYGREEE